MRPRAQSLRIAGHLGELIQGRLGPSGPVALVSLPAPGLWVEMRRMRGAFNMHQINGLSIYKRYLRYVFKVTSQPFSGRWQLLSHMPIGAGAGASTASLLALSGLLRPDWPRARHEALCLALEGASDPLLAPQPERLLWASRQAREIAQLPPLPRLRILGGFLAGRKRTDPADQNFPDISDLMAAWPEACANPAALGALTSRAAKRRLAQTGEAAEELEGLAQSFGAYGFSIAYTGTARAFLLPVAAPAAKALKAELLARGYSHLQNYCIGGK